MNHSKYQQNNWNDVKQDKVEYSVLIVFGFIVGTLLFLFNKLG